MAYAFILNMPKYLKINNNEAIGQVIAQVKKKIHTHTHTHKHKTLTALSTHWWFVFIEIEIYLDIEEP